MEGAALTKGNLIARLSEPESKREVVSRDWIIISYEGGIEGATSMVWAFIIDASSLLAYLGEMNRMFFERELMFQLMDASERSTQFRINEILAELRKPVDEIGSLE